MQSVKSVLAIQIQSHAAQLRAGMAKIEIIPTGGGAPGWISSVHVGNAKRMIAVAVHGRKV
jgi:hypothetical protein